MATNAIEMLRVRDDVELLATDEARATTRFDAGVDAGIVSALAGSDAVSNFVTGNFSNAMFTEPLARPIFDQALDMPSVTLQRVEPFSAVFLNARHTLQGLRERALQPAASGARSLIQRVQDFLAKYADAAALRASAPELHGEDGRFDPAFKGEVPRLTDKLPGEGSATYNEHSALFAASRVLTDDIRTMELLRNALSTLRRHKQRELERRRQTAIDLARQIDGGRGTLDQAERARIEALDDYAVAQRLLLEHFRGVERAREERARVLRNHQGLYAVKVREVPVCFTLPDPLALRGARIDDIVPGCPAEPVPVAPALLPFLDAVLDIPVADWAALGDLGPRLPGREALTALVGLRKQKLQWRVAQPAAASAAGPAALGPLLQANHESARELLTRRFDATALAALQQQGRRILALEDLLASARPALRAPAQALLGRLQAAAGCLLERMRGLPPALRLDWGNAADADRLPVETPERWPGLAQAEDDDFNATRTLIELVGWWFAQLDADASGSARTAMRNFVRACLVLAATDDPQQMLHGRVKSVPPRFVPGAALRLQLNREPLPGSMLQLFDAGQRVVALLRVDDHDEGGTLATIADVFESGATLDTSMQVSGVQRRG